MSAPQEIDNLLEDTIPQHKIQASIENEKQRLPKTCQNGDNITTEECFPGLPTAGSSPRERSGFEFQNNLESSTKSNEKDVGVDEQRSSSVDTMNKYSKVSPSKPLTVMEEEVRRRFGSTFVWYSLVLSKRAFSF